MAITISVADYNDDGTGINFAAYLSNFQKTYVDATGRGDFNGKTTGDIMSQTNPVGAKSYITTDSEENGGRSVIFNSPDKFIYDFFGGHVISGKLQSLVFGDHTVATPIGAGESKYTNSADITISGFPADYVTTSQKGEIIGDVLNAKKNGIGSLDDFLHSDSIIFNGSTGNDTFTGYSRADTVNGGDGNDKLYGDKGNDRVYGDKGNDTLAGGIGNDRVYGGDGNDFMHGDAGNDTVTGGIGDDKLYGDDGNDYLNGEAGVDRFYGGKGNDTYIVDNTKDAISETGGDGTDLVKSSVTFKLATGVENLVLTGTAKINATGNTGANVIIGNSAQNVLTGGTGKDVFVFNTALKSASYDTIKDFSHADDTFDIDNSVFSGLSTGTLASTAFKQISGATSTVGVDSSDRILYDKLHGDLYFDRDGSGTHYDRVKFAHVTADTALSYNDFHIV